MVNKVILIGRVGNAPETGTTSNGVNYARFSVATSDVSMNKDTGEKTKRTDWHNVTVWRDLADIVTKYMKKGDLVYIEGRLRTDEYYKDDEKRKYTYILGDALRMLGSKSTEAEKPAQNENKSANSMEYIPF